MAQITPRPEMTNLDDSKEFRYVLSAADVTRMVIGGAMMLPLFGPDPILIEGVWIRAGKCPSAACKLQLGVVLAADTTAAASSSTGSYGTGVKSATGVVVVSASTTPYSREITSTVTLGTSGQHALTQMPLIAATSTDTTAAAGYVTNGGTTAAVTGPPANNILKPGDFPVLVASAQDLTGAIDVGIFIRYRVLKTGQPAIN